MNTSPTASPLPLTREQIEEICTKTAIGGTDQLGLIQQALAALTLQERCDRLAAALNNIFDFTTGYDDVAGIVNKIAREALAATSKQEES